MPTFAYKRTRRERAIITSQLVDDAVDLALRILFTERERHGELSGRLELRGRGWDTGNGLRGRGLYIFWGHCLTYLTDEKEQVFHVRREAGHFTFVV